MRQVRELLSNLETASAKHENLQEVLQADLAALRRQTDLLRQEIDAEKAAGKALQLENAGKS